MNIHTKPALGQLSPREEREEANRIYDFTCDDCGEKWDTPGHMFWLCRMYCEKCGNETEAR
jgi:uncharacterized OB-fold protein